MFELLNFDLSQRLGPLSPAEQITAAQCAHIGQPVTLAIGRDQRELSILRMVIGARFFTIVGYAGAGTTEAALASEIADAIRAIDKVELLAERWGLDYRTGSRPIAGEPISLALPTAISLVGSMRK